MHMAIKNTTLTKYIVESNDFNNLEMEPSVIAGHSSNQKNITDMITIVLTALNNAIIRFFITHNLAITHIRAQTTADRLDQRIPFSHLSFPQYPYFAKSSYFC